MLSLGCFGEASDNVALNETGRIADDAFTMFIELMLGIDERAGEIAEALMGRRQLFREVGRGTLDPRAKCAGRLF